MTVELPPRSGPAHCRHNKVLVNGIFCTNFSIVYVLGGALRLDSVVVAFQSVKC